MLHLLLGNPKHLAILGVTIVRSNGCLPMRERGLSKDVKIVSDTSILFTCGRTSKRIKKKRKLWRIMGSPTDLIYARHVRRVFATECFQIILRSMTVDNLN